MGDDDPPIPSGRVVEEGMTEDDKYDDDPLKKVHRRKPRPRRRKRHENLPIRSDARDTEG
jgi:hypothetical protein